jgi:ferric-dicitrate binding protein FerR (iron transport regulator)
VNGNYEPSAEFSDLLVGLTEGDLDTTQRAKLNEIMSADEQARDYYVRYISTHAMLEFRHQGPPVLDLPLVVEGEGLIPRRKASSSTWFGFVVAASILLVVSIGVYRVGYQDRLTTVGTLIPGSRIQLEDGTVTEKFQIGRGTAGETGVRGELDSGVLLAIEGRAQFEVLEDTGRFKLIRGKMRVRVPPEAVGFTIVAGGHEVVDLGTEFGVSVDKHDDIEVHVFEGSVKVADQYELKKGDAQFLDHKGNPGKPRLEGKQFPSMQ